MWRTVLITFVIGLLATAPMAQDRSVAKIKSAYIFRFAENTTWKNERDWDSFNIGIYGNAPRVEAELSEIKKSYQLKGLPIKLSRVRNLDDLSNIQLLYIPNLNCTVISSVLDRALSQNILMVSDQCESASATMINFIYQKDNKIQFEVNSTHIKNAGLSINPKLLLLSGDESEALEMFIESEKSLQNEKQRTDQLKKELSLLQQEWQRQKIKYDQQKVLIDDQLKLLNAQKKEMNILSDSIELQQRRYAGLQTSIESQAVVIMEQQAILAQKLRETELQSQEFLINKRRLEEQSKTLDDQLNLINEHESKIDKQVYIIQLQKYGLILAILIISLILSFIVSIVRNSRIKKRAFALLESKNIELVDRQNEISRQNDELKSQRKELMEMTEALSKKSEELQASIAEVEKANAEIREINENLEETVRLRTEELREQHEKILNYLSHNSHIVRGPLSRILGLTNLFSSMKPEETTQLLEDITTAAEEVDRVVNEINGVLESEREKF